MKSYTDLEQSKKLAEFLPLESADMRYKAYYDSKNNLKYEPVFTSTIIPLRAYIPCWSLAALTSVLPDTITNNDGIAFKLNIEKNIIGYSNPPLYLIYKYVKSDNLVDACIELILKLNELNLL